MYGCLLSPYDARDYKAKDYLAAGARPATFEQNPAPILHQGAIGSCVAHALATLKFYQERRERRTAAQWSTDFIYHNRKSEDWQGDGLYPRQALAQLAKCGVCRREDLPSNTNYPNAAVDQQIAALLPKAEPQRVKSYVRCEDMNDLCECIYQNGAAIMTIKVKQSFKNFWLKNRKSWVLPLPADNEKEYGYHCICAVGYNDDGIVIQNSWGENWGADGLAVLPWNYTIYEMWGVVDVAEKWDIIELPLDSEKARVNGQEVALDVPPQIVNGRTLIPIRFVGENLGCEVEYLADERTVIVRRRKNV